MYIYIYMPVLGVSESIDGCCVLQNSLQHIHKTWYESNYGTFLPCLFCLYQCMAILPCFDGNDLHFEDCSKIKSSYDSERELSTCQSLCKKAKSDCTTTIALDGLSILECTIKFTDRFATFPGRCVFPSDDLDKRKQRHCDSSYLHSFFDLYGRIIETQHTRPLDC